MEAHGILRKSMCEQKAKVVRRQFPHAKHATEARVINSLWNGFETLRRMTLTDGEESKITIMEEGIQSPRKFIKSETRNSSARYNKLQKLLLFILLR